MFTAIHHRTMSINAKLVEFIVVLVTLPFLVGLLDNDVFNELQKHTPVLMRFGLYILLLIVCCAFYHYFVIKGSEDESLTGRIHTHQPVPDVEAALHSEMTGRELHGRVLPASEANRASTPQPARREGPGEINPRPMEIDRLTNGIEQLNDSVYVLHTPPQGVQPTEGVILSHGLPQEDEDSSIGEDEYGSSGSVSSESDTSSGPESNEMEGRASVTSTADALQTVPTTRESSTPEEVINDSHLEPEIQPLHQQGSEAQRDPCHADFTVGSNASCQPARSEKLPEEIERLNDSVYELYTPPEGVEPKVVVIFFHGLPQEDDYKEAYWKTWKSRDGKVVWPKEWLPERLPNPWILSVSYDSYACEHDGAIDSYALAENLIRNIILDDARVGQDCPVVLVGHGLGGIVIKEFLLACLNRRGLFSNETDKLRIELIDNFLDNCKGVFYYSTPHRGSVFFENVAFFEILGGSAPPLMKLLGILSSQTARINSAFARLGEVITTQAVGENLDTTYKGFKGRIVHEASGRYNGSHYYTVYANHFDVCKAQNDKWCPVFNSLLEFIKPAMEDKRQGLGLRSRARPTLYRS